MDNWLPYAVLLFGAIGMVIGYLVLRDHQKYWMSEAIVIIGIPMSVTAVLLLITTKPEAELTSLLAALIGYIAGYGTPKSSTSKSQQNT